MYRERAEFQRLNEGSVDAYGNVYTGWSALISRWVEMREVSGRESIQGGALSDVGQATIRVLSPSTTQTITSADRVLCRGKYWNIKDVVQVDAKNTMLEFKLERGVAT